VSRALTVRTALLLLSWLAIAASPQTGGQGPYKPADGPAKPERDPITVRGCLDGKRLRIVEHDVAELSGVRYVTLKAPRALMKQLADYRNAYVEVTGQLELPPGDRIEARKKYKVGSKTTVSVATKGEQMDSFPTSVDSYVSTLEVEAFKALDEDRCQAPADW
jgi:hypothetical protein